MRGVVVTSSLCALVAAAALAVGAGAGAPRPLPPLRIDRTGWSAASTYTIGEAVTYGFAFRNRARVPLKIVEVRLTLPAGWRVVQGTLPLPQHVTGSTVVWRYTNVGQRGLKLRSLRQLRLDLEVGGKPGSACLKAVVRGLRPVTAVATTRGCNKVVDGVFH